MWHRVGRVWHCSACANLPLIFYSFPPLFSRLLSSSLRACSGLASSLLLVPSRTICSCLIFGPNCQLFGTNLRLCTIRNALFLPSVNRDLGFAKTKHLWGLFGVLRPFTTANFCHFLQNRDMVWAALARSGLPWRDLWGVLWEWTRKSLLVRQALR